MEFQQKSEIFGILKIQVSPDRGPACSGKPLRKTGAIFLDGNRAGFVSSGLASALRGAKGSSKRVAMSTLDTSDCRLRTPLPQGLYHPRNEHDACGMGLVASIRGEKSHEIVRKGLEVLINLTHRGAAGCDPETGDGAGILIQIPHEFFARDCGELGTQLPGRGEYGVAMVFQIGRAHV